MVLHTKSFIPHTYEALVAMRAFPENAVPEVAYTKLCSDYALVEDIEVSRITYENDGLAITGLMATPNVATPPKGLVIYNRGGSGNYGMLTVHAVLRQFIPLARAGYVVVGSNYRGNDGGDGQDEFGGRDVDDVIALYNLVKSDDTPPFLIGHSRGGMMNYLLMKRGFAVRACVSISAVSDLTESALARPEMRERVYKRYIPDFEANEAACLAERSAICWPEKITPPTLLLHGTNDEAVPHSQSEQLAELLSCPHKLVLYEGGNHALTRQWSDVMRQTLEWLEIYA